MWLTIIVYTFGVFATINDLKQHGKYQIVNYKLVYHQQDLCHQQVVRTSANGRGEI